MNANEICVPANSLAEPGEDGAAMSPGVGDEVEVSVTGRVTRAEGGNVYLQPVAVNGRPVESGDGEESLDDEERELSALNHGAAAMPLLVALLLCLLGFTAGAADLEWARRRSTSGGAVSNQVTVINTTLGSTNGLQAFSVEIDNYGSVTNYLLVFDSNTNQLANATPHFTSLAIPPGSTGSKNWGPSGAPFLYGVNVCLSTTPFSLTNAVTGGTATVIWSPVKP